jgi:hypothetical protein
VSPEEHDVTREVIVEGRLVEVAEAGPGGEVRTT